MDSDEDSSGDDFLYAPDGTPVIESELEIIREQYDAWTEENDSAEMSFGAFVQNVYFAGCPASVVVDDATVQTSPASSSMYPDLSAYQDSNADDAPASLSMTATTGTEERLPVLERGTPTTTATSGRAVPGLDLFTSGAQDTDSVPFLELYTTLQEPLPTLVLNSSSKDLLPTQSQHGARKVSHVVVVSATGTEVPYPMLIPVAARKPRTTTRTNATVHAVDRHRSTSNNSSFLSDAVPTLDRLGVGEAGTSGENAAHLPDWTPTTCSSEAQSSVPSESKFISDSELTDLLGGIRGLGAESFFNSSASGPTTDKHHRRRRRREDPELERYIPLPTVGLSAQHQQQRRKCPVGYALDGRRAMERSDCPVAAGEMTLQSRAVLQHAFSVIRDQFSAERDPALFTQRACCSRSSLATLAAELRGALASVEASDWKRPVENGTSEHHATTPLLSPRRVRSAAIDGKDGDRRIAFVAAATVLAGGLAQSAYSDAVRAALSSASPTRVGAITDPFVRTMHESWYRLMKQAQKQMGRDVTGAAANTAAFVIFGPISAETTRIDRKTAKASVETLVQIWGAMAATITIMSITTMLDKGRQVSGAQAWADALIAELQLFSGMQFEPTSAPVVSVQASLLTETTIAGKVKKGLRIIVKDARDAQPASRIRAATDGTSKFILAFLTKLKKHDRDTPGRKLDFVKAFLSATCGIIFMRDVERNINGIDGLEHLRESVVLTPTRSALSLLEGQRDTLPQ